MFRHVCMLSIVLNLLLLPGVEAAQQVTLNSGTRIIGEVELQGQTVAIKIDDRELTVPLSDVDLIAPVDTTAGLRSPGQLLLIALESRIHHGSNEGLVGLLAEAQRQAPEDARIALDLRG